LTVLFVAVGFAPADSPDVEEVAAGDAPAVELGLESFDRAWEIVRDRHFDADMGGVDWDAVRAELRPRAVQAKSLDELRTVINEMLSRLGMSHFGLLPKESVDALEPTAEERVAPEAPTAEDTAEKAASSVTGAQGEGGEATEEPSPEPPESPSKETGAGDAGFDVRLLGEGILVTRVAEAGPAAAAGVRVGWIVEAINGRPLQPRLDTIPESLDPRVRALYAMQIVSNRLDGDAGSEVVVTFIDGQDTKVEVRLTRRAKSGTSVQVGNLPPMASYAKHRWVEEGDERIGYLYFNVWMVPIARSIDEAVDVFRQADGFILDLRGNPGGIASMAMGVAGHFLTERVKLGTMKTRSNDIQFNANPRLVNRENKRVEPYAGPLAILVDSASGSTSEMFAAGMQYCGRARIFGQTSMGAALPALMERLPNEDVLLHAVGDYVLPDGSRVEGRGVVPDEPVELTRALLLRDPDPALTAAQLWITSHEKPAAVEVEPTH
jgi:carboxyl-terminal processing protease